MTLPASRRPLDQGETLIELVIAVMILGIAAVAITVGLTLSVKVSDIHRKETTAAATVRNYAEFLENAVAGGGYVPGTGAYPAFTAPTGYTASVVGTKNCWNGSAFQSCASVADNGLQQLKLQVASNDGRATEQLVVVLRKPCAPDPANLNTATC